MTDSPRRFGVIQRNAAWMNVCSCGTYGIAANDCKWPILLKNSKSQRQQIFVQRESNRKIAPRYACGPLRGSTLRHQFFLVPPQLEASLALWNSPEFFILERNRVFQQNRPTAAVPYVRRKRVLEESGSCLEGQLT